MARFLFVYRDCGESTTMITPAERQQQMQAWEKWLGEALRAGWMLDPGDALTPEGRVVSGKAVTDGPFAETKEVVGGFSVVEAATIDDAAQLARGCPGVVTGGTVEVRPLAGYTAKISP